MRALFVPRTFTPADQYTLTRELLEHGASVTSATSPMPPNIFADTHGTQAVTHPTQFQVPAHFINPATGRAAVSYATPAIASDQETLRRMEMFVDRPLPVPAPDTPSGAFYSRTGILLVRRGRMIFCTIGHTVQVGRTVLSIARALQRKGTRSGY